MEAVSVVKSSTVLLVENILKSFAADQAPKIASWAGVDLRAAYPFHRLVFPDNAVVAARLERSIVTAMGTRLYPPLARAVALDRFSRVWLDRAIEGILNDAACNMIEQIVTELRSRRQPGRHRRVPDHAVEMTDIISSRGGGARTVPLTADVYVEDFTGGPLFIELKTPLPNLDIAAESKRKMLYYLAMMERRNIKGATAYLGLTYNPFGSRAQYRHSFTRQIMDMEHEVLMGQELWDHLGGPGTYVELLDIIDRVRLAP